MKVKRALLSVFSGMVNHFTTIVLGIIIPRLLITNYGSEINGMISSVSGIFVYLSLLEAGVGAASRQALYAPIVNKDQDKINGILSATKKYFNKTGIFFLACVSVLAFVYPVVVKSDISYFVVVAVILLMSVTSLINYFFQGKYTVLLNADNRSYILSWFNTASVVIVDISKIVLILLGYNIIMVQVSATIVTILKIFMMQKFYIRKNYKKLDFSVKSDNAAISQKNAVFLIQIKGVIFNNIDVLVLSIFCNLKIVSVYSIYSMIFKNIYSLPSTIYLGMTSSFGHLYAENFKKFKRIFNAFEVYYTPLVFTLFIVAYILTIPFISLYTKGVTDINYVDHWLPLIFLTIYLLISLRYCPDRVVYMAGHFRTTQTQATIEMLINLILSITLVHFWGIYGVLIATIISLIYRSIDLVIYTSRKILFRSSWIPFRRWLINLGIGVFLIYFLQNLNLSTSNYIDLFIMAFVLTICIGAVYFVLISLMEKDARKLMFEYTNAIFKKILRVN